MVSIISKRLSDKIFAICLNWVALIRPTMNRPTITRPTITRPTITRPTITRPTI